MSGPISKLTVALREEAGAEITNAVVWWLRRYISDQLPEDVLDQLNTYPVVVASLRHGHIHLARGWCSL